MQQTSKSELAARLLAVDISQIERRDRLQLAEYLWHSVATLPDASKLAAVECRKLNRRIKLYRDSPFTGTQWNDVKERLSWY
ncbi:MAG: addiction module protein [Synechococcales bacterium]|nr:addiction module protein [Synechococcales bacterium]